MGKILLIDNYDSFTYNLYHYLEEVAHDEIIVKRNDEIDLAEINTFESIVISPGPGLPKEAGRLMEFLNLFGQRKKILGICLGQQAIAEQFGMKLKKLNRVIHGQSQSIKVLQRNDTLFQNLPEQFLVGRYHSWVIDPNSFSPEFEITSVDEADNIMSIAHKFLPISAVQFHPESILTEYGKEILVNWLDHASN